MKLVTTFLCVDVIHDIIPSLPIRKALLGWNAFFIQLFWSLEISHNSGFAYAYSSQVCDVNSPLANLHITQMWVSWAGSGAQYSVLLCQEFIAERVGATVTEFLNIRYTAVISNNVFQWTKLYKAENTFAISY